MKKLNRKARLRDVRNGLKARASRTYKSSILTPEHNWHDVTEWLEANIGKNIVADLIDENKVVLYLPEIMNFSSEFDTTIKYIAAIRKLVKTHWIPKDAYRLSSVNFDSLREISTSAALVLTAELSRWDDYSRNKVTPNVETWDPSIFRKLYDIGFFDLFDVKPTLEPPKVKDVSDKVSVIKYHKGFAQTDEATITRALKKSVEDLVGKDVNEWTLLHGGLLEAINNVVDHAFPDLPGRRRIDKCWYLTGAFDSDSNRLKIVFYDQGIGIPQSFKLKGMGPNTRSYLEKFPLVERWDHERLLDAAVAVGRTSTKKKTRGKGLKDLMNFIEKNANGYLTIMSLKGLYKYQMETNNGVKYNQTLQEGMPGTLIIWSVTL